MKTGARLCLLSALSASIFACSTPEPRSVKMSLGAVNTADKILVLEGETDLPPGSRLKAELQNRDGKVVLRDKSVVRGGQFFFDFDLERLSEFTAYRVRVVFDPQDAPLGVRQVTGLWGEALEGPGVRKKLGRNMFFAEKEILLSAQAKGRDWEGRDWVEMEPSERLRLTESMERFLEEKPDDKIAKLALAQAYLAAEPNEYAVGSRAHLLLTDAARTTETDRQGRLARELLKKIEKQEVVRKKKEAKKKAQASGDRYRKNFVVQPGKSLGGFGLGTPYKVAARYFELDKRAKFQSGGKNPTVKLVKFHGVQLTYGASSRRLVRARTNSPKFKLPEGLGVGDLLQSFQGKFGKKAIPTPKKFRPAGEKGGKKLYRATVKTKGLDIEVTREVDSEFGIPVDRVSALTVKR